MQHSFYNIVMCEELLQQQALYTLYSLTEETWSAALRLTPVETYLLPLLHFIELRVSSTAVQWYISTYMKTECQTAKFLFEEYGPALNF